MLALVSRWKLKNGCPPELAEAVQALVAAVREKEEGTLVYSVNLPGPHPPIGPPPDYAYVEGIPSQPAEATDLVFFEVYRDANAFSEHLRGAIAVFMKEHRHHFATPWQGHPRPEVTYLDPQGLVVREELVEAAVR
jgi:quinol monooxygenase YgiN